MLQEQLKDKFYNHLIAVNLCLKYCARIALNLLTVHNGSKLIIQFHSDSAENGKGFIAHNNTIIWEQCKTKAIILFNAHTHTHTHTHTHLTSVRAHYDNAIITAPHSKLKNGGCAHTSCVPIGATRMCQCNAGYELSDDGG